MLNNLIEYVQYNTDHLYCISSENSKLAKLQQNYLINTRKVAGKFH